MAMMAMVLPAEAGVDVSKCGKTTYRRGRGLTWLDHLCRVMMLALVHDLAEADVGGAHAGVLLSKMGR